MLHEGRQRRTAMRGVLEALEAGELEIAAARLDATRVPFGDDPRLMLLEAELAWARGQPSRSVDLARRYGRVAPDSSQVRLVLAGYLHATGLDHLAAEELNAAIERRPFAAELRRLRIAVLEGTGAPAGVLARARAELATLTEIALPSESTRDRSTDQDRLYAVLRLIQLPSAAEQATMEGERIPPGPYD
jgi:predicted Zn-dependent protease